MRKLVLFLVSLLFAAENAAAQVPDIGQKKDKPQLSLTDTVKNIDRGDGTETKPEDEEDKGIFSFMNFSFSKKKESKKPPGPMIIANANVFFSAIIKMSSFKNRRK